MKNFLGTLTLGIAVWALPGAGTMSAADIQSKGIAVPFAFKVDKVTLPAGHYKVEQNIGKPMVYMVNLETGHRVQIRREIGGASANATLTFEKTDSGFKLSKVS